jgi:glycosidase
MKRIKLLILLPALLAGFSLLVFTGCNSNIKKNKKVTKVIKSRHPEWSKNSNIYEVNIRQYTPEGTINAFRRHLPRLKAMNVDILWLMPVFPIGEKNRKGSLGSYYAVKDYKGVNPEFGTLDDLKALVKECHDMGMYVILDWVANHTAWDNPWATQHPEWYEKDDNGNFKSPYDWTDVIQLDYTNAELRKAMTEAMKYWVVNADIDGFRCDVAGMVPVDFWNQAKEELDKTKHLFMLAEDEENIDLLKKAFDMNYTWKMMHLMNGIAKGEHKAKEINDYLKWNDERFDKNMYRMYFTSNHDENSWNGTAFERLGEAFEAFTVFDYTIPGMPLIYSGQEAGNNKRLRFFDKDTIDWIKIPYSGFYAKLNELKHNNKALWNGEYGGALNILPDNGNANIFAFIREKDNNQVVTILNLSPEKTEFKIENNTIQGKYTDLFTGKTVDVQQDYIFDLQAWGYVVLVK